ncbi:MAG: dihydroorotase [Blautia sp.]|nr:dihydroorotase [Blautia sp.]
MGILIKNGRIVDASTHTDMTGDLYMDGGMILEVGKDLSGREADDKVIDARGCLVMPGLVDMHVHLRDPGQTQKEDILTGARAAARGGVTTLVAMPNTSPVIDSPDRMSYVINKAAQVSPIHVIQAGALTQGENGESLADIPGMAGIGARAFSEDGKSVMNSALMKSAMLLTKEAQAVILDHCEDINLRGRGCMNDDENARRLRLPGISNAAEDVIAARDIVLALETGARLHLCHCSTEGTVRMMQAVKKSGKDNITAEVCPHHLLLTSDDIPRDDPNYKMNPPLRTKKDVQALIEGLQDGSIDVISTDHAPHTPKDKSGSMATAAFGIVGLETSFPLIYTCLVEAGHLSLLQMVEKMSWNPARILGLSCGTLKEGSPADVIVADVKEEYTIDREQFLSKGKNTPFDGWKVKGRILYTICDGKIVYREEKHD